MVGERMTEPSLSILIPTRFPDKPLARALLSIQKQIEPNDEVLIAIDTHSEKAAKSIIDIVESFGNQYKWFEVDAGHHCWGHCQLNFLLKQATKDYIVVNDDDDIFSKGAFDSIREVIKSLPEPMLIMFKFLPYHMKVPLWQEKKLALGRIGGHNLVHPNVKEKMGLFSCRYEGDFDWVLSTCWKWEHKIYWAEQIIVIARPGEKDWPENWK
jgi:glycosyltransferase involved in cell wall biosynthesis